MIIRPNTETFCNAPLNDFIRVINRETGYETRMRMVEVEDRPSTVRTRLHFTDGHYWPIYDDNLIRRFRFEVDEARLEELRQDFPLFFGSKSPREVVEGLGWEVVEG